MAAQDKGELWVMLEIVKTIKPKVIVEIGVDGGDLLMTWQRAFSPTLLVGIDVHEVGRLKENLSLNGLRAKMIYGDSQSEETVEKLKKVLQGKAVDFLFIDGDHHYAACKRDYELYSPFVRKGGFIGFHDIQNRRLKDVGVSGFMHDLDHHWSYLTVDITIGGKASPGTRLIQA